LRDKLSHRRSIGPEHPRPAKCPVTRESDSFASRQGTMRYLHMRIALIVSPFISVPPTRYGGTELFLAHLAEGLERRGVGAVVSSEGGSKRWCIATANPRSTQRSDPTIHGPSGRCPPRPPAC